MTQDRRMSLTVAAAVVLVSTVMFPAFLGTIWFYAGIGAALIVAGAGMLSRLRTLPVTVCLLISLIALLLYLNLAFEAGRSIIGIIPSWASMAGLWSLAHQGFTEASKYAAPAPTLPGLMLLAVSGIGITAVLTDLIAVRLRSAAMAGLPLLVLFTVPVAINGNRSSLSIIVIFTLAASGYLALLSADGRERINGWGRLISLWRSYDGDAKDARNAPGAATRSPYHVLRGPDTKSLSAAGRRVGLASIVLALCTPLLLPGLRAARLASSDWVIGPGSGLSNAPGLYDPLTAAAQDLKEAKPTTVLTYTTDAPASLQANYPQYLQQYVYTTLTADDGWQTPFSATTTTYPFNTQLPGQAPGITNNSSPQVRMVISISPTAGFPNSSVNLLPAPYPPVRVYATGSWEYEPSTLMLVTQHESLDGLDYTVISHDVDPVPATLNALALPPANPANTQLPSSYTHSAALLHLALKITDKTTTEYGKVTAIQNWLHATGGFTYDTYASQIENVTDLLTYLTKTKSGDCVQSAFAMTVLLRMLGIPARVAVGFTQGNPTATPNRYVVKTSDAHAWPEVFFRGYGWLAFAPTPQGQGSALTPGYAGGTGSGSSGQGTIPSGADSTTPKQPSGSGINVHLHDLGDGGVVPVTGTVAAKPSAGTPWLALALAVLAAVGLASWVIRALAPAGHRAIAARQAMGPRQRVSPGAVLSVLAGAGLVALVLYRVLSHTKGLDLGSGWATVGIAFGSACAVALAVPVTCRAVVRRWRWMRAAGDDADMAHAAWEELRADLADYGVGYLPSESPRALASRVTNGLALAEPAVEAVSRIALAEERATYAARPSDAEGLRQDGATARRGIAAVSGRTVRWRARLFPASTMAAMADVAIRVPEAWATRVRPRLLPRARNASLDA